MSHKQPGLRIGITLGDPAGIGPEIAYKALDAGNLDSSWEYRLIGSAEGHTPGKPTPDSAREAWVALDNAVNALKSGELDALVTAPIYKAGMHAVGFPHPGHTEYLAHHFPSSGHAMILCGGHLVVALATVHQPLATVAASVTAQTVESKGRLLASFLRLRLGRMPRIAVAGLNPHAGEDGLLGVEEREAIRPAVERLANSGCAEFEGPCAPDTVFLRCMDGRADGVLCMYHDQGLIPLKLHAFFEGVNVTWGLPVVRTSPDHGAAFDIAGRNLADFRSMTAAIRLAAELAQAQRADAVT